MAETQTSAAPMRDRLMLKLSAQTSGYLRRRWPAGRVKIDSVSGGPFDQRYDLGHETEELERLNVQGRALAGPTRSLLEAAGVCEGMRVLDLGSGAEDMSFVVADVVGHAGDVDGLERAPEAVAEATVRAERQGRANVRFVQGDIHDRYDEGVFDAVVCRLVLMYVADPSAVNALNPIPFRSWRSERPCAARRHRPDSAPGDRAKWNRNTGGGDIDTLQPRIREEMQSHRAVFAFPALTCAWAFV
jgi:SAM-dependent methyltransferase